MLQRGMPDREDSGGGQVAAGESIHRGDQQHRPFTHRIETLDDTADLRVEAPPCLDEEDRPRCRHQQHRGQEAGCNPARRAREIQAGNDRHRQHWSEPDIGIEGAEEFARQDSDGQRQHGCPKHHRPVDPQPEQHGAACRQQA